MTGSTEAADAPGGAPDLVGLRAAVLSEVAEMGRPPEGSPSDHTTERLNRRGLGRVVTLWKVAAAARSLFRDHGRSWARQEALARHYRGARGLDQHTARAEVMRLTLQLHTLADGSAPGLSPVTGPELERATDALLRYYLAGRRTDDADLSRAMACWSAWEEVMEQELAQRTEHGLVRGLFRRRPAGVPGRGDRLLSEYAEAWRGWLDRPSRGGSHGTGPQDPPRE